MLIDFFYFPARTSSPGPCCRKRQQGPGDKVGAEKADRRKTAAELFELLM